MCNSHSCVVFAWNATDWTACRSVNSAPYDTPNPWIEGITCGIGRQTRTLTCVRVGNWKPSPAKRYVSVYRIIPIKGTPTVYEIWNTVTFDQIMQCTSWDTFWKGNEPENPYMT